MLRAMHSAARTWVVKFLMLFLAVSFSIWGVGDIFRGNPQQRNVACIGGFYIPFGSIFNSGASLCTGQPISMYDLMEEYKRNYDGLRQKAGVNFNRAMANQLGLVDRTLHAITMRALFDRAVNDFNLNFDDAFILKHLANMPDLLRADGSFNREAFQRITREMQMSEAGFIDYLRRTTQREALLNSLAAAAIPPESYTQQLLEADGQQRVMQALRLAHESMPEPRKPSDGDLEKFYAAHMDMFKVPERRSAFILRILMDDMAKNTVITDSDLKEAFVKRRDEFALPERRDLQQVVLGDEEQAKKLAESAKANQNLKRAAEAIKKNVVALDEQTEANILPALFANVFAADEGNVIGPIKSDFGWHVIQIMKIKPAVSPELAEVKDKLRSKMQLERAGDEIQNLAAKIDDDLAGGKPLDEIAGFYKLQLMKFADVNAAGRAEDGKNSGLPSPELTLKPLFAQSEGETSGLLEDGKGNFLVVHVDKVTPSHVPPIAAIRDKVTVAWRLDQHTQAAAKIAEEIAESWRKNSAAYAALSKKQGVKPVALQPLSMLDVFDKNLPSSMQSVVFNLALDEVAVGADKDAHYIVKLAGVKPYDASKNVAAQNAVKADIPRNWREDILKQYEELLKQHVPVRINQIVLNEFIEQTAGEN